MSNLKADEQLVGIDFRPLTGRLYGIGRRQVYVIDITSGFATLIGAPFSPALEGAEFGVDFNPQADRIRVVSTSRVYVIDPCWRYALVAVLRADGGWLYSVDLQSGPAHERGMIGQSEAVRDLALAPLSS